MSQLVRDNPSGDPDASDHVAPVFTEPVNECVTPSGTGQEKAVGWETILGTQQAEAINQLDNEGIHRVKAFGFHLAKGHMNSPAVADQAETIGG